MALYVTCSEENATPEGVPIPGQSNGIQYEQQQADCAQEDFEAGAGTDYLAQEEREAAHHEVDEEKQDGAAANESQGEGCSFARKVALGRGGRGQGQGVLDA